MGEIVFGQIYAWGDRSAKLVPDLRLGIIEPIVFNKIIFPLDRQKVKGDRFISLLIHFMDVFFDKFFMSLDVAKDHIENSGRDNKISPGLPTTAQKIGGLKTGLRVFLSGGDDHLREDIYTQIIDVFVTPLLQKPVVVTEPAADIQERIKTYLIWDQLGEDFEPNILGLFGVPGDTGRAIEPVLRESR